MRTILLAASAALGILATDAGAASTKVDLRTKEGVEAVKGGWRYHDVKLVEVPAKAADGSATTTYQVEPKAGAADFDDGDWPLIDPATLKNPRGGGQVCFAWYRIKVTIPEAAAGKSVFFQTTVDDYGEVWVDGQLPCKPGDVGGPVVAGFNTPNRLELKDARPGKTYRIAVFGINGPISAMPGNRIFLGPTFLEFVDK